jgi:hypothetical protein
MNSQDRPSNPLKNPSPTGSGLSEQAKRTLDTIVRLEQQGLIQTPKPERGKIKR